MAEMKEIKRCEEQVWRMSKHLELAYQTESSKINKNNKINNNKPNSQGQYD